MERPESVDTALDWVFFVLGGVAAVWLAVVLARESLTLGWGLIWFVVLFWVLIAYLVLPRLHRILTSIYVPDYFIGRARTSDGLLGDPVNLALLGSEAQLHATMERAGWIRADDLSLASGLRIVRSTLLRRSYLEAPVSPLLLFGRQQDFAYQMEVGGSPGKRHHVRFWRCPPDWRLPGGHIAEWLAAGTYDRSVGFSLFTLQVTHKIAPDTDVERDHIVSTMRAADSLVEVSVIDDFSTGYHSRNGGGDSIVTDGDLPIVDVTGVLGTDEDVLPTDSRDKRPGPTILGAAFVAGSSIASLLTAGLLFLNRDSLAKELGEIDDEALTGALWLTASLYIAIAIVQLFVAWRIFLGRNWARVFAMTLGVFTLTSQFIAIELADPTENVLISAIPNLCFDVLLLLALSSERARRYARRHRKAPKRLSGRPGNVTSV